MISLPTLLPGPVVLIILALSPFKRVVRWKCINLDSLLQYKALFEESPLVKAHRQLIQRRTFLTRPEHEFHETKLCISAELCLIRPSLRTLKGQRVLFDAHPKTEALKSDLLQIKTAFSKHSLSLHHFKRELFAPEQVWLYCMGQRRRRV